MQEIHQLFKAQQINRWNMAQSSVTDRVSRLKRLKQAILATQDQLKAALYADFKKPAAEVPEKK